MTVWPSGAAAPEHGTEVQLQLLCEALDAVVNAAKALTPWCLLVVFRSMLAAGSCEQ